MNDHVSLVGPGGIGKTSSGPYLARLLGREFLDLDAQFMGEVGHIGDHIERHGYADYVCQNAEVFFRHLARMASPHVVALSSGFLIAETEFDIVLGNRRTVADRVRSVMPLPHADRETCATIVTDRPVRRGQSPTAERERPKFLKRLAI
ncbi:MAG: shikimate kinase [Pseudomonadota bacterium]